MIAKRKRKRDAAKREEKGCKEHKCGVHVCVFVCVFVCVRERERGNTITSQRMLLT